MAPSPRLILLGALAACTPDSTNPKGSAGTPRDAPSCDDGEAITLGEEGGFSVDSFDFTYEWSDEMLVAVGPVFLFDLRSDISGLAATVDTPGAGVGFAFWGLNDDVYIDAARADETDGAWWSEPFYHWGGEGVSVAMPINNETLPDGGGCLFVQPAVLEDLSGDDAVLHMVTKRTDVGTGAINVNIVIVGGASLSQSDLDASVARMDDVWTGGGGPSVGTVDLYELDGSSYLNYADSNDLRAVELSGSDPQAINLFIIDDYADEPGTLGEAGGIPGPLGLQGVDGAGVIVALDGHRMGDGSLDVATMGETMAHEVGHQVGLFHTTESDGSSTESISDTADCPGSADDGDGYFTAEECADYDGRNFMFWVTGGFTQDEVSAEQALVLSRSVVAN